MENRFRRSFAPVKVGDEISVKIESVGEKGDGIAKVQGFVIIVPGAKEGEEVKIRITRVLRKLGFGEIVGEGEPSERPQEENTEEQYGEEEPEEDQAEEDLEDTEDFGEEEKQ